MRHDGLSDTPRELFGYAAQEFCIGICQEFVDAIQANPNVPERTGRMKAGFHVREHRGGAEVVNPAAFYWAYVEFGHDVVDDAGNVVGHAHARPYARPAWEEVRARHV